MVWLLSCTLFCIYFCTVVFETLVPSLSVFLLSILINSLQKDSLTTLTVITLHPPILYKQGLLAIIFRDVFVCSVFLVTAVAFILGFFCSCSCGSCVKFYPYFFSLKKKLIIFYFLSFWNFKFRTLVFILFFFFIVTITFFYLFGFCLDLVFF